MQIIRHRTIPILWAPPFPEALIAVTPTRKALPLEILFIPQSLD